MFEPKGSRKFPEPYKQDEHQVGETLKAIAGVAVGILSVSAILAVSTCVIINLLFTWGI